MDAQLCDHGAEPSPLIDVVVVAYNSREVIRDTVLPLARESDMHVIVVDNASPDDSRSVVADLPVEWIRSERNGGFAYGCNRGWRAGRAPYVLFLNPDARIDPDSVRTLISVLQEIPGSGVAAPLIRSSQGRLEFSIRRFPSLRSTYAQALFLHRLFPDASWSDQIVRDPRVYEERTVADWVSGACLVVKRSVLEQLGGWDEQFFLYCEDNDLCRRVHQSGLEIVFEPTAIAVHAGGRSERRSRLLPILAESRIRYARKHQVGISRLLEQLGIFLGALTHVLVSRGGLEQRAGHARSIVKAVSVR